MNSGYTYEGSELDVFAAATRWKRYFGRVLRPYLKGDILEAGAGIGGTTVVLHDGSASSWTCLEPDAALAGQLATRIASHGLASNTRVVVGNLSSLAPDLRFHCILYIDVLEHIEDDRSELERAGVRLHPDGTLVVLSPAHQWLFTPFDTAIGHCRRYNLANLHRITPANLRLDRAFYLDSVGLLASLANKLLLRQSQPTLKQVRFWDGVLVPASGVMDPLLARRIGKSVVGIWRPAAGPI